MTSPPRLAILVAMTLALSASLAEAKTKARLHKPSTPSLAALNLRPTGEGLGRPYTAGAFEAERFPTHAAYEFNPLVSGSVGYQTSPNARIIAPYEVNQAAGTRFGSPDTTIGASMAYKF